MKSKVKSTSLAKTFNYKTIKTKNWGFENQNHLL